MSEQAREGSLNWMSRGLLMLVRAIDRLIDWSSRESARNQPNLYSLPLQRGSVALPHSLTYTIRRAWQREQQNKQWIDRSEWEAIFRIFRIFFANGKMRPLPWRKSTRVPMEMALLLLLLGDYKTHTHEPSTHTNTRDSWVLIVDHSSVYVSLLFSLKPLTSNKTNKQTT